MGNPPVVASLSKDGAHSCFSNLKAQLVSQLSKWCLLFLLSSSNKQALVTV